MKSRNNNISTVPNHIAEESLIAFLDGEVDAETQQELQSHLDRCWNCRSRLNGFERSIENFLRIRQETLLPPDLPPSPPALELFRKRLTAHRVMDAAPSFVNVRLFTLRQVFGRISGLIDQVNSSAITPLFILRAMAVIVLVSVIVGWVLLSGRFSAVSASELFQRSEAAERSLGKVTHRRVSIRGVSVDANKGFETKTIEAWRNAEGNLKIQRVYNENDELVVITRVSDNKITTFTSDQVKTKMTLIPIASPQMAKIQQAWKNGLSVAEFQKLIGGANNAKVEEAADSYIVNYKDNEGNFKATLTLEKESLRPISQHLEYQINGKSFVYEFTEISYEVLEPNAVNNSIFVVDENFNELSSKTIE